MKKWMITWLLLSAFALAQEQAPAAPEDGETEEQPSVVWKPDNRPASSAVPRTEGAAGSGASLQSLYNSFIANFSFTQNAGARKGNLNGQDSGMSSVIQGGIRAGKRWGAHEFRTSYQGGMSYFYDTPRPERVFHSVFVSQNFGFGKWTLGLHDQMRYTPESGFGFEPTSGRDLDGLDPSVTPNDSVLTNFGRRLNNTASADLGYRIGRKDTISASASYGLFRLLDSLGGIESDQVNFRSSYEHRFDRKSSAFATYSYGYIDFIGNFPGIDFHTFSLGYSRQVTGKVTVQASAGPHIRRMGIFGTGSTNDDLTWAANASARYRWRNASMGMSFSRGTANGGGIMRGSVQNRMEANGMFKVKRTYTNSIRFGFSRNQSLRASGGSDAVYGGYDLTRSFGKSLTGRLGYFAQAQNTTSVCAGSLCSFDGLRHGVVFGFSWTFKPLDLLEGR